MSTIDPNYLHDGFINEVKPALDRWNNAGGSGGGGVGVATQIDHGYGSATFVLGSDVTVPAGGSVGMIEPSEETFVNTSAAGIKPGYIYGHPEITAHQHYSAKYGCYLKTVWNSSATDFVFKAGETYTLVYLYIPA